ncbi:hypothetical protein J6590_055468 [Homalodisca vitripennis]|nr:hypothetical protein J6590_055468 [Homalodisca vitripennis]
MKSRRDEEIRLGDKLLRKLRSILVEEASDRFGLVDNTILPQCLIIVVPVCRPGQQWTVPAARQDPARITCEVEANPANNLQFSWKFNNSLKTEDIADSSFTVDRTRSTATFTPFTDTDFGSLLCWAKNELGVQREPCVYNIVPAAGRPEPLGNCTIVNQTADSLLVECDPGHDGGLPQLFVLEVYDVTDRSLVHNTTSRSPVFLVTDLPPGLELDLVLYSANSKGRSQPSLLHAYTLRSAARRSVISPVMMHMTPVLGVLAGAVITFICVLIAIVVVIRLRKSSFLEKKRHKNTASCSHTSSDSVDSLDKNPDIIPQNNDIADPEETSFHKSKLSFYFNPECVEKTPAKAMFSKDYTELQMPTAAYWEQSSTPRSDHPRRVTFQCQAATLPRRLGSTSSSFTTRTLTATDDSVLDIPATLVRLRPETSSGPLSSTHL